MAYLSNFFGFVKSSFNSSIKLEVATESNANLMHLSSSSIPFCPSFEAVILSTSRASGSLPLNISHLQANVIITKSSLGTLVITYIIQIPHT